MPLLTSYEIYGKINKILLKEGSQVFTRHKLNNRAEIQKSVFMTKISLRNERDDDFKPGGYCFFKNEKKVRYEEVVSFITSVINDELKSKCQKGVNLPIESIEVVTTYEGSIVVVFSAFLNILQVVSGLKDLYDSIEIIRVLANEHLNKRLKAEYGDYFYVYTETMIPNRREREIYDDFIYRSHKAHMINTKQLYRRDGFFCYLLISNIILFAFLGILVFNAVSKMYW